MDLQLLKAAINPAPAKQESQLQKTGDEHKLDIARLTSQWINKASLTELKQVLNYAMTKVGLRASNWPADAEKELLIDHIVKNFGGHSLDEIRLAFDMAIAGKLEFKKDESVNCFENFSCLYFSSIMNAYRSWAVTAHKFIIVEPVQKIYTEEEILNQRRGEIETAYQAMRKGYYPILHSYFFEVLNRDGLILQQDRENEETDKQTVDNFFVRKINSNAENIYTK